MTLPLSNHPLHKLLKKRILVFDGAMGTMIQQSNLSEADFCGQQFKNHPVDLKGNNDLLSLTKPSIIEHIHSSYLKAGADIIITNTFNANAISQRDYGLEKHVFQMNNSSAQLAKKCADKFTKKIFKKPRWVAGSIGPTNRTASISPDPDNPSFRNVTFSQLVKAYIEQANGLIKGGVDILLVETIFDTLNAKAAFFAIESCFKKINKQLPVMVSITISDNSGRTLTGQTIEAFIISIYRDYIFSIGLNCGMGARTMQPYLEKLSRLVPCYTHCYPNAGLPNEMGKYNESPSIMSRHIKKYVQQGLLNMVGACCGSSPKHISEIANSVYKLEPRKIKSRTIYPSFSGLESLIIKKESPFVNIGERTNVAGSKEFADLIKQKNYKQAASIARSQVSAGALMLDINTDLAMLDPKKAMSNFLNYISSEPEIAKVPIMLDSSDWMVIEAGLKCIQGKPVVNSISLKHGEKEFIRRAKMLKQYGAAVVVMAFDEKGQAVTLGRRIDICVRSYGILTKKVKLLPQDIIFDPNVLAIATGIKEHNNYAKDYFNAVRILKKKFPECSVTGGISNVSFSFRGNNFIRQAIHSVFLHHAVKAGLDMGIVNPSTMIDYKKIDNHLAKLIEDVLFNKNSQTTDKLIEFAQQNNLVDQKSIKKTIWRKLPVEKRLTYALVKGIDSYLENDIKQALNKFKNPIQIIEGPLMRGVNEVGQRFGSGEMFLPQVVKTARVMKIAVDYLQPFIKRNKKTDKKEKIAKILLATVKGDVHDIGKNIVKLVLECNNFKIIDLGIMIPSERIVKTAIKEKADMIGLSGLITPSLLEMAKVALAMQKNKLTVPLLIGGATTSANHTAIKIASQYPSGLAVHVKDASKSVLIARSLINPGEKRKLIKKINKENAIKQQTHFKNVASKGSVSLVEARKNTFNLDWQKIKISKPNLLGVKVFKNYNLANLIKYIDWTFFFTAWGIRGRFPRILNDSEKGKEATKLYKDAKQFLQHIINKKMLIARAVFGIWPANSIGDDIELYANKDRNKILATFHFLRQQRQNGNQTFLSLADFIAPKNLGPRDYLGIFAVTTGINCDKWAEKYEKGGDEYGSLMIKLLADRLAEALAQKLHESVAKKYWGYYDKKITDNNSMGIRPAPGYPACPDHTEKRTLFNLLDVENQIGIKLTKNYAMQPNASVCGYYFANPRSKYFAVGNISRDQVKNYAKRKKISIKNAEKWLHTNLSY